MKSIADILLERRDIICSIGETIKAIQNEGYTREQAEEGLRKELLKTYVPYGDAEDGILLREEISKKMKNRY